MVMLSIFLNTDNGLGAVTHACNPPALWEAEGVGSSEIRSLRPAWPTWRNLAFTKKKYKK